MDFNIGIIIICVFTVLITIIFSTFFSARLAQLKGRTRVWGLLGFLFNIPGLIIVCFLPSKRKNGMQTNPILYAVSRLPSPSRKTIGLLIGLAVTIVITAVAYDRIPQIIVNYRYANDVTKKTASNFEQPKLINGKVQSVYTGMNSSYIVTENGDLFCWGHQLSKPLDNDQRGVIYKNAKKALSTETALFVLTTDGKLYALGTFTTGPVLSADEFTLISDNVTDFSVSETTVGYIKSNGKLYMYGDNHYGQLGNRGTDLAANPQSVLDNVQQVCCESEYTVALRKSGEVVAFGGNTYGQFGKEEPSFNAPVVIFKEIAEIASGDDFILMLDKHGSLFSCGANSHGQLGNGTNERALSPSRIMTDIAHISAAKSSALAVSSNGTLYTWGQNNLGQLGNGDEKNLLSPSAVQDSVIYAVTSGLHTLIIRENGSVLSTGFDSHGQLGKGGARNTFSALTSIK